MEASILIVEDEYVVALDLQERLCRLGFCEARICHNYEDALTEIVRKPPSVALLDINLGKGKSGIDLARLICDNWDFPIIFITAYSTDDVISDALEALPSAYITKPFKDTDIKSNILVALNKQKHPLASSPPNHEPAAQGKLYFTKERNTLLPVSTDQIQWLETMDNYTRIYTQEGKHMVHSHMKDILEKIGENFIRIHRSYAVAIDKITKIEGNYVFLGTQHLSLGARYKKEVLSKLRLL